MRKMPGEEFDELVDYFDAMVQTKWLSAIHEKLKAITGSWEGKNVLDVGCGTGRLLLRGAAEASHINGIDISAGMIEASKRNAELAGVAHKSTFQVADAYELPFQNETFDFSLSTCVLFLLPEPLRGLEEMVRVTKKEGRIAMLNPSLNMNKESAYAYSEAKRMIGYEQESLIKWSNISELRHRYSPEELSGTLKRLGAKEVSHEEVLDGLAIITNVKL